MKHRIRPDLFDHPVHIAEIARIAMSKLDTPKLQQPAEIARVAVPAQVVEKLQLPPLLAQMGCDIAADKPVPAGHQGLTIHLPLALCLWVSRRNLIIRSSVMP
jgi:hypothetical protein